MASGVHVSFHIGSPEGEEVCSTTTEESLEPGECEQVGCLWQEIVRDTDYEVYAVVDGDEDVGIAECHEGNNTASAEVRCPPIMI